jgi:hypothetical protein
VKVEAIKRTMREKSRFWTTPDGPGPRQSTLVAADQEPPRPFQGLDDLWPAAQVPDLLDQLVDALLQLVQDVIIIFVISRRKGPR